MEPNQPPTPNQPPSAEVTPPATNPASPTTNVTIPTGNNNNTLPTHRNWLPWAIGGGVILLLLIVISALAYGLSLLSNLFRYTSPPPEATPAPQVEVKPIAPKFASDSAILDLRDRLGQIRKDVDSADLIEPQISPPALDLNISIKTNQWNVQCTIYKYTINAKWQISMPTPTKTSTVESSNM